MSALLSSEGTLSTQSSRRALRKAVVQRLSSADGKSAAFDDPLERKVRSLVARAKLLLIAFKTFLQHSLSCFLLFFPFFACIEDNHASCAIHFGTCCTYLRRVRPIDAFSMMQ